MVTEISQKAVCNHSKKVEIVMKYLSSTLGLICIILSVCLLMVLKGNLEVKYKGISIQTPMTISNNTVDGKNVKIQLVKGRYYEDWNPGAVMGTIYEGDFEIVVSDDVGHVLSKYELPQIHEGEPNTFTSIFNLAFNDYNSDGVIDFAIGQYASSNGSDFKFFTLNEDNTVKELKIKNTPYIFHSSADRYSSNFEQVDTLSFANEYYDNSKSKQYKDVYKWNHSEFEKVESREMKGE